jgi:hypothetical protein
MIIGFHFSVAAIIVPDSGAVPPVNNTHITEEGDTRLTEEGDEKVIE